MGLHVFQKIEIWTPIWDPHGLPRASKIDPGALKITIFDLPSSVYDSGDDFWGQKNDFVSNLVAWALPNRHKNSKKSSLLSLVPLGRTSFPFFLKKAACGENGDSRRRSFLDHC